MAPCFLADCCEDGYKLCFASPAFKPMHVQSMAWHSKTRASNLYLDVLWHLAIAIAYRHLSI